MNAVSRGNAGAGAVLDGGGGVVPESARVPLRELMDDRLLDALLERSRCTPVKVECGRRVVRAALRRSW
jgi:hypothetical protein